MSENNNTAMQSVVRNASVKSLCFVVFNFSMASISAAQVAPNSGTILQQVQPIKPPAPAANDTELKIERASPTKNLPESAPFPVNSIRIVGNSSIDTTILHALIVDAEHKDLTLSDLSELATRITRYYQSKNYPLTRAIIPAQTIQSGVVTIEVIEAHYGINFRNLRLHQLFRAKFSKIFQSKF